MKFNVDSNKCVGCGACVDRFSEYFAFDSEGYSKVISDTVPENAQEAVDLCPVEAISIVNKCCCGDDCQCGEDCNCDDNCDCNSDCSCGDNCHCNE